MTAAPTTPDTAEPLLHLGGNVWCHPDLEPLLDTDINQLRPHPTNARNGDTDAIAASIQTNGLYRPLYAQRSTGHILAGNHTYAAALELGATHLPVIWLDIDDEAALRILIADNRTADLGTYDDALLAQTLTALTATETALLGTGYTDDDLTTLMQDLAAAEAAALDIDSEGRGGLLDIADLSVGEPTREVHHGQVWRVGPHTLVVVNPHREWSAYVGLLTGDAILAPYPDIYLPMTDTAQEHTMILVQPNTYLAGHLLDKYAACYPDATVEQVQP